MGKLLFLAFVSILAGGLVIAGSNTTEAQSFDWRDDWEVEDGFSISLDTEGYDLPTSIAFVPNPGPKDKDPLYFVTELKGTVKAVTNDRTVVTFAEDFIASANLSVETGMAGICLAPKQGYVFVTFAYEDSSKTLRNNVIRFETEPITFSTRPFNQINFTDMFLPYESGPSHQIGECQVHNDLVYISVGDGLNTAQKSQQLDSLSGKVIRMDLDGKPVADNPFYQDENILNATNYVWSYGLRNPFGLSIAKNRVFVADNGKSVDRFMEIREGVNYLWNATDWSIGTNADFVISPSVGLAQLDFYPEDSSMFPEFFRDRFYLAVSGAIQKGKKPGIMAIKYGFDGNRVVEVPELFLRYRPPDVQQLIAGVAFGPDGLYFVPILPNQVGQSAIFRITYDPAKAHPHLFNQVKGFYLMLQKGCLGCHVADGIPAGYGGSAGPSLQTDLLVNRLTKRLHSASYIQSLAEIDNLDREPFILYKDARRDVLEAEGLERVRVWMKYRIQEPRFDTLHSQMPNLGVSEEKAILLTNFLLTGTELGFTDRTLKSVRTLLPEEPRRRHLLFYFGSGFLIGNIFLLTLYVSVRSIRTRFRIRYHDSSFARLTLP